ncbi:MAG TPA: DUF4920 domain-containing protein [Longimicrobiales bacterium]|nr:DUF4920 domain-containing protein [Longimicrobiales bacterium]
MPEADVGADATAAAAEFAVADFAGTSYGEAITLTSVTPVSAILDDPAAYIGQRVLVQGMVVAVCEEKGCWMDIASDREFEKVQIKVDDGVIVFPLNARGKQALVEGVVEELQLTEEQAIAEGRRKAEEHGETFDPASVQGPQTIFRIRGAGAVIAD